MPEVIVPNWNIRKLSPGFTWQRYFACATNKITTGLFEVKYSNKKSSMLYDYESWKDRVLAYLHNKTRELGLEISKVGCHCQEEPDQAKPIETMIWSSMNLFCVWSVWGYLLGPVPEDKARPEQDLPLERFWPRQAANMLTPEIAEIIDATQLTLTEQEGR